MPTTITSSGTVSKCVGRGFQSHLFYAVNDAAWWLLWIDSAATTLVKTFRSPDLTTWTAKGNLTFASAGVHNSNAHDFAVLYKNKASTDVVWINFYHETPHLWMYCRATISAGAITFGTETQYDNNAGVTQFGVSVAWANNDFVYMGTTEQGNVGEFKSTNADAGSSWTSGFSAIATLDTTSSVGFGSQSSHATSTNRALNIYDLGSNGATTTGYHSTTWDGTTIGSNLAIVTGLTAQDKNDFGTAHVSDTDIHIVYRTGSNTYGHKRWNGTNWTSVAGATIPNQTSLSTAGHFMATDGTDAWLFVIDSAAGNAALYIKWTASGNTWGTWTTLEASSATRGFISGYPSVVSNTIAVIWSQTNGSNFDIVVTSLSLASGAIIKSYDIPSLLPDTIVRVPY